MSVLVVDGRSVAPLEVLESPVARTRGLLGRDGLDGAVLLRPAMSVHTVGMRFAIDVAFVDGQGRVVRTATMPPRRVGRPVLRARSVVEAQAGSFARWGLGPGCAVVVGEQAGTDG